MEKRLLFIIEYGVYPELIHALQADGWTVTVENIMRKAISHMKKEKPPIVIAEFFHEPMFRDRVSNLESMLAHLQRNLPEAKIIILYAEEEAEYLKLVTDRFDVDQTLSQSIAPLQLIKEVNRVSWILKNI